MTTSSVLRSTQSFTEPGVEDTAVCLKEFLRGHTMPCFARIAKDRRKYNGPGPEEEVSVYLYSVINVRYVAAEEMSVVHRKHIQPTSQRFNVPLDCKGWFEVLSQDGISARPFGSVGELAKLGSSTRCLVRQSVGGYVRKAEGYDTQIIRKGDVLTLHETMWISARSGGGTFNKQLLRCVDQRSQEVYLDINLRGLFSPVAGHTSVTGAHTVQSLLTKFRLPVMVRLLYGNIHQAAGSTYSTGVFKLMSVFTDEILFALPLGAKADDRILPISTRAKSLKARSLQKPRNDAIQNLRRQCRAMVARHLDTVLSVAALHESSPLLAGVEFEPLAASAEKKDHHSKSSKPRSSSTPASPEEEQLFREIEDIYNSIGCNPELVPRPIVFTTETAVGSKGLRRNVTAVPKVKTVQYRVSSAAAQRTRIIDDNWQMLPRQMTSSAVQLHATSEHNNVLTNDVQVQTTPKPERGKRKPIPNTIVPFRNKEAKHGDHLYEEIPYFSKTNMDVSSMDIQKTVYISDTSLSRPDSLPEVFDKDTTGVRNSEKERESVDHSLPRPVTSHSHYPGGSESTLTIRSRLSRPKSYAGTPFFDGLTLVGGNLSNSLENPPPLPPKRGESMCNLRDELTCAHSPTVEDTEPTKTPSPTPIRDNASTDPPMGVDSTPDGPSPTTADRRTSSKVSSAVKTLGNVSRSFLNTIRRIGARSSATLVINSTDIDDPKPVNGEGSCMESGAKSSARSSPEPQTPSEKMATKEPSLSVTPDNALLTF